MQIPAIEISDRTARVLGPWASVSRTLDNARFGLEVAQEKADDESAKERFAHCENEIETIQRAISDLHQAAQYQIWRSERGEYTSLEKFGMYCCLRGRHGEDSHSVNECYEAFKDDTRFCELVCNTFE